MPAKPKWMWFSSQNHTNSRHTGTKTIRGIRLFESCYSKGNIRKEAPWIKELIGISVNDKFCINRYCFSNMNIQQFNIYLNQLDSMIKTAKRSHITIMIASDFNAKSTAWGDNKTDRRETYQLDIVVKNEMTPIGYI